MPVSIHQRRTRPRGRWAAAAVAATLAAVGVVSSDVEAAQNVAVYEIQGAGHISPLVGQEVRVRAVVTAKAFNGFYMQDPSGDGDDATSDGIFVSTFRGDFDLEDIEVGQRVKVDGVVSEFIPGGASTGNLSITQIISASVKPNNGRARGQGTPTPVLIGEGGRIAPAVDVISESELPVNLQDEPGVFNPTEDGIDFYESLEGMLVTVDAPVAVGATRRFNSFSAEMFALPSGGSDAIIEPDDARTGRGGIALQPDPQNQGDQNPERIQIQFDPTISGGAPVPLIPVGAELDDVTGVVGYSFGNFEVNALHEVTFTGSGPDPETTSLVGNENALTVASYNVLNLDPGDGEQFDIVGAHIADNLGSPDVVALQEIQDNNGTAPGVLEADETLQLLVDAIADAGGPVYEAIDHAPAVENEFGGQPNGNIRNAFLWNADRVTLTDLESLDVSAFPVGSRDPLIGTFDFDGNEVIVANNHFTSRFGSTPVFGGPQPFVQAGEQEREDQSKAMNQFVDDVLAADPDANVIVTGDLNTFEWTDELAEDLPGVGDDRVLTNLALSNLDPSDANDLYTFIFDGNSQALDHMFVTDSLGGGAVDVVHVNVDYPRDLGDAGVGSDHEPLVGRFSFAPFSLQVLHASDLEGGVDALDRAPNFAAIVDALEDNDVADASITLSAGDNYIPGPFFSASGDRATFRDSGLFNDVYNELFVTPEYNGLREGGGRVDISIMNITGFDASAIGNHEFDLGSDAMESIIEEDFRDPAGPASDRWVGSQFPYLSANLDFSGDGDLGNLFTSDLLPSTAFETGPDESLAGASDTPKIAPYTIVEAGGEQIGVVGATTPLIEQISSPGATVIGPTDNDMPALAAVVQPAVDVVLGAGVDKVVLVSHLQQLALEEELVPLLNGIDISIAGGSDSLLANPDDVLRPGDAIDEQYPVITTNADGDPAVIVSTDGEYSYVGQLNVAFDDVGRLIGTDGAPLTDLAQLDLAVNGPVKTETPEVVSLWGSEEAAFAPGTKGELVERLVEAARGVVIAKDSNVTGETDVFLEGRREKVRTEETNLGNLGADANLAEAQAFDSTVVASLKNGGGLRAEIGEIVNAGGTTTFLPPQANPVSGKLEGQISQLDIENSLRFNNGLTLLTLTADQFQAIMEHAVAATAPGNTPGQFPQVGGMRFSFDPTQPVGNRVVSLDLTDASGTVTESVIAGGAIVDSIATYRIVTLNFLAGGGDGYPFPSDPAANRVDLVGTLTDAGAFDFAPAGSEQDALAEYLDDNHPIGGGTPYDIEETPPVLDRRIVNLSL